MDNDLFTATETLNSAFREVLEQNKPKSKWGRRSVLKRLKEAIEQRNLTISEKLLLCYNVDHKDLFSSRDTKSRNEEHLRKKFIATGNEEKLLCDTFRKLSKNEQDRIWKEIGMYDLFHREEKSLRNNNTKPFEHSKNKGRKNGK